MKICFIGTDSNEVSIYYILSKGFTVLYFGDIRFMAKLTGLYRQFEVCGSIKLRIVELTIGDCSAKLTFI